MYVISYDLGTTGLKTCLFDVEKNRSIELVAGQEAGIDLIVLDNGGVEQDPLQWWQAMCDTTKKLIAGTGVEREDVKGISFCAQMQALVLVDESCEPVRNAMSYMDNRAQEQIDKYLHRGLKVAGMNVHILLTSLKQTGAVAASVKDPVWRYRWVADNEPEVYGRIYKWLDAKDFLTAKATGNFTMSADSAFGTMLYDTRPGKRCFSRKLCGMLDVNMNHLPEIVDSTEQVGRILPERADELGLAAGTPVFSGGGDASLIGVGAGAVNAGESHVYMGTSAWIITVIEKQKLDVGSAIASIVGVDPESFNAFAELDTGGKCFEWAKNNVLSGGTNWAEIADKVKDIPAGSGGLVFTPWLHGNRCPFEDPNARGVFFGIGLDTTREEMYNAVLEGVCMHIRWQAESMAKLIRPSDPIRFTGGGALQDKVCQVLADVLDRTVEVPADPKNSGSVGAAVMTAAGLGIIETLREVRNMVAVDKVFRPDPANTAVYDELFEVFKSLYRDNRKSYSRIQAASK